jgi:hypothetical protein
MIYMALHLVGIITKVLVLVLTTLCNTMIEEGGVLHRALVMGLLLTDVQGRLHYSTPHRHFRRSITLGRDMEEVGMMTGGHRQWTDGMNSTILLLVVDLLRVLDEGIIIMTM